MLVPLLVILMRVVVWELNTLDGVEDIGVEVELGCDELVEMVDVDGVINGLVADVVDDTTPLAVVGTHQ
jgi:hypothetical protein